MHTMKNVTLSLTEREAQVLMQCLNTRQDENMHYIKNCKQLGFEILHAKYLQDNHDIESIRTQVVSQWKPKTI